MKLTKRQKHWLAGGAAVGAGAALLSRRKGIRAAESFIPRLSAGAERPQLRGTFKNALDLRYIPDSTRKTLPRGLYRLHVAMGRLTREQLHSISGTPITISKRSTDQIPLYAVVNRDSVPVGHVLLQLKPDSIEAVDVASHMPGHLLGSNLKERVANVRRLTGQLREYHGQKPISGWRISGMRSKLKPDKQTQIFKVKRLKKPNG